MTDPIQSPPERSTFGVDAAQFTPGLYLVATPIGNAADITLRALALLQHADLVACEDSRVTGPLLRRYGIDTSLFPYHEHNAAKVRPQLIEKLQGGAVVALVSDAGTPLINDPGYKLVRACIEAGIAVTALPGASAVLAGLSVSGLPSDRFLFAGFPPPKTAARRKWLAELAGIPATLVMLESAQRLGDSLADMESVFGPAREAAVTRELTKKFEEVRRGTLHDLAAHYAAHGAPKGEITLVIAPPAEQAAASAADLDSALAEAMARLPLRQAVDEVAVLLGLGRKPVYARALALRDGDSRDGGTD
ncbi:MAG: 16S rRNA (cytidine(1402)-2'-O)-methyltransferase [Ferrovibrio sp.]|uniref:16S rRNA (cytidine(1402)-2'-O)-methyltransferase n=1 Tax=Ferrovibrio sp. TaxID=1917215 RepID=UPI0026191E9F|nr:16S rRNA (cytidine(1402)-2'-O)-methyltransferase [Ferrovibrio sp.]MCW0233949.1 16S rRNA (cytidine(1402)-2'-O)-methyltransferase [Ferrovibrio sp.]